jgi:hypothetical protein
MRLLVLTTVFGAIGALPSIRGPGVRAQIPAVKFDVLAAKGVVVSPVCEGWYEVDGTRYALFGYSDRHLEEIVDIPIGPHNHAAPGPPDQGLPTRFFPGMDERLRQGHCGGGRAAAVNDRHSPSRRVRSLV